MMNPLKTARPTPRRLWPRCVPWPPPLDLPIYGVGKHNGRDWRRNKDAGVFYPPPPSSFAPQRPKRSSENPTAVFVVPTPQAHSYHNTQTKQREFHHCLRRSHTPSLFASQHSDEDGDNPTAVFIVPIYSCKPVTLAVQSSGFPPLFCCTHTPYNGSVWGQHPTASYPVPSSLPIRFPNTILQPPSCNSCRTLPLPLLSKCP